VLNIDSPPLSVLVNIPTKEWSYTEDQRARNQIAEGFPNKNCDMKGM
jgi:hypothetical protein